MALVTRGALLALLLLAGCYAPGVRECAITCGAGGACPSGTTCLADNYCHATSTGSLCGLTPDAPGAVADARSPDARVFDARPGEPDARLVDAPLPDARLLYDAPPDARVAPDGPGPDAPGCTPILEDIDTEGKPLYTNLGIDLGRTLHVSYVRSTSGTLWHASKPPGGTWKREQVDFAAQELKGQIVDLLGGVHVAWTDDSGGGTVLRYGYLPAGGSWHTETVTDQGEPVDATLAVDALANRHIAYYDRAQQTLGYATRGALQTSWTLHTIDDNGQVGETPSLAIGPSSGRLFVTYRDADRTNLKLARLVNAAWQVSTIDNNGDIGTYSALAIDLAGLLHIAYGDVTNGTTRYMLLDPNGGQPTRVVADSTKNTGRYNAIGLDLAGGVYVATDFFVDNDVHLARRPAGQGAFSMIPVETAGSLGRHTSLAVDPGGGVHLSYVDDTHGTIRHAYVCP